MNEKTKIITNSRDTQYNGWTEGEEGYIDGYVKGGDGRPYAAVVLTKRKVVELIPLNHLTVSGWG